MPRRPSSGDRAGGLGSAIAKKIDRLSSSSLISVEDSPMAPNIFHDASVATTIR